MIVINTMDEAENLLLSKGVVDNINTIISKETAEIQLLEHDLKRRCSSDGNDELSEENEDSYAYY